MKEIKVIGITGNMGSGKSTASHYIEKKGYKVLYSDIIAKDIIENNEEVKNKIIQQFGTESYSGDKYNANYISKKVYSTQAEDKNNMQKLNAIIHPAVIDELMNRIEQSATDGEEIIFVESALIFELGLEEGFDYVINIFCSDSISIDRIISRNTNINREQAEKRINAQMPNSEKRILADFTVINESGIEELYKSIDRLLNIII